MRAHELRRLYRTFGDTDQWEIRLRLQEDAGIAYVPDSATVKLHIATSPVTEITGTPRGDSLGYFFFATSGISVPVNGLAWEVQVTDGSIEYTIARGTIIEAAQIN